MNRLPSLQRSQRSNKAPSTLKGQCQEGTSFNLLTIIAAGRHHAGKAGPSCDIDFLERPATGLNRSEGSLMTCQEGPSIDILLFLLPRVRRDAVRALLSRRDSTGKTIAAEFPAACFARDLQHRDSTPWCLNTSEKRKEI
jgi:hypothetical protein